MLSKKLSFTSPLLLLLDTLCCTLYTQQVAVMLMPTERPRVSWILEKEVIDALQKASDENDRPVAKQANRILREWLKDQGYLQITNY